MSSRSEGPTWQFERWNDTIRQTLSQFEQAARQSQNLNMQYFHPSPHPQEPQLAQFQDYPPLPYRKRAAENNENMPATSRYQNSENLRAPIIPIPATAWPSGWHNPDTGSGNDPRYPPGSHHPLPLRHLPHSQGQDPPPSNDNHPYFNTGFEMGSLSNPLVLGQEHLQHQVKYPGQSRTREEMKEELARSLACDSNVSCLPGFKFRESPTFESHPAYRQDEESRSAGISRRKFFPNQNQWESSIIPRRFSDSANSPGADFYITPPSPTDSLYRSFTTSSIPSSPFPSNYPHHLTFPGSSSLPGLAACFHPRPLPDTMANQFGGLPAKFRARNEKTGTWLSMGTPGSCDTSLQEAKAIKEGYRQELEKQIEQGRMRREEEIRREKDINDHPLGSHYAQPKSYIQPKSLAPPNLTALDTANQIVQDEARASIKGKLANPTGQLPADRVSSPNSPSSGSSELERESVKGGENSIRPGLEPSASLSRSTTSPATVPGNDPNSGTRIPHWFTSPLHPSNQSSWPMYPCPGSGPPLALGPPPPPPQMFPYVPPFLPPPHPLSIPNYFPPLPAYPSNPIMPGTITPVQLSPAIQSAPSCHPTPHPSLPQAIPTKLTDQRQFKSQDRNKLSPGSHPGPPQDARHVQDFMPPGSRKPQDFNSPNPQKGGHYRREGKSGGGGGGGDGAHTEEDLLLKHYTWQTSDQLPDPALKTMLYKKELRRQIIQKQKDTEERAVREREEDEKLERRIREHEERMRREVVEEQKRFYQKTGLKDLIWRLGGNEERSQGGERERREGVIKEKAKYGIHHEQKEPMKTPQGDPSGLSAERPPPLTFHSSSLRRDNIQYYEERIREKCNKSRDDNSFVSDFHPPPDDPSRYHGYPLPPETVVANRIATQPDSSLKAKLQEQLDHSPHNGQGDNEQVSVSQPLSHILDSLNLETLRMERVIRRKMNL